MDIPSHLFDMLPPSVKAELEAMEHLSDEAIRRIAFSVTSAEHNDKIEDLTALKQDGTFTSAQQQRLTELIFLSEALMLRKAHAFVLLKQRGYTLPTLDELHHGAIALTLHPPIDD